MIRARAILGILALTTAFGVAGAASAQPKHPATTAKKEPPKPAKAPAIAITGATVHTGTGEVIEGATIVIDNGVIQAVGKGVAAPAGATVVSRAGAVITPGLVDLVTSVGLIEVDLEESTHDDRQSGGDLVRAGFRAADGYNPASIVIGITRAEGVTSVGVVPNGGLFSGQSAWADLDGATAKDAIAAAPLALHVHLGSAAPGGGHANAIHRVREALEDARAFQKNRAAWERNQSRAFAPRRLDLEALTLALGKKLPVVFHVDRAADILSALDVAKEFDLRPVIAGGAEAWRVAPLLAKASVSVIVYPLLAGPESFDALGARDDNAALLHAAGVAVSISTDETHNARKLRQVAGNAVRAGLPHEAAITAITLAPATALGLGARYGSIEKGKVANVVVWTGDPLEIGTHPITVYVRGREVSLRTRQTELFEKYRAAPGAMESAVQ